MADPTPKPDHRRQRRNSRPAVDVQSGGRGSVPEPKDAWLECTKEKWDRYWSSDVAMAIEQESDSAGVERLFDLYDERERAAAGYRAKRLVEGSQGQPVLNPLARMINKFDSEIRQLEDRFGMNPKARLQLGIQMTEAQKGLNSLMDGLDPYADDTDDDDDRDDEAPLRAV